MAQSSTARRLEEALPQSVAKQPAFGGGEPPAPPVRPNPTIGSNARVGTLMFLGAEAMFFAGLIGAYIVFRFGSAIWPPPFQPRLPVGVTGVNTLILIASAVTMRWSLKAVRVNDRKMLIRCLAYTAVLGGIFLLIQGFEWLPIDSFRPDGFQQRVRQLVLHADWISRAACVWRADLASGGARAG